MLAARKLRNGVNNGQIQTKFLISIEGSPYAGLLSMNFYVHMGNLGLREDTGYSNPRRRKKKMTIEATIKDCITTGTYERRLACVTSDSEVQEAIKLMRERDIKSVLVKENDEYVGIVTETDLLFDVFISQNDPKTTKVSFIMTKPIITMYQDKSLK